MLKFKLYYDKDEEQAWLNAMAEKGWGFKTFFLGFYTFEACQSGEYNYQIDILDNWQGDKDNYAQFMEDVGVEVVGQWWRWVYLRKKTALGTFELYTDIESKIRQYSKIRNFFIPFTVLEICCFFIEVTAAVEAKSYTFGIFAILFGVISIALIRIVWKNKVKIMQYKQQI